MADLPLRYPPSGPFITDADGNPVTPGNGFTLRLEDAQSSTGTVVFNTGNWVPINAVGATLFELSLADPKPGLRYGAELWIPLSNTGAAVAELWLRASWKVDAGAYVPVPSGESQKTSFVNAANTTAGVFYRAGLTLGSALSAPVLDGSSLLSVSFEGRDESGDGQVVGPTMFGRIVETL